MKCIVILSIGVIDAQHGPTHGRAELFAPGVINEGHDTDHWKCNTFHRRCCVARIVLDADIHRSIVHVVLNPFSIHQLSAEYIVATTELKIGTEVNSPSYSAVAEVILISVIIFPLNEAGNSSNFYIANWDSLPEFSGKIGYAKSWSNTLQF